MKRKAIVPPEWLTGSAIYQINPRTFSSAGTIEAVTKELPRLKELGFRIMYLCPVFEEDDSENTENWSIRQKRSGTGNPKNPYRMNDYFTIDSEYGTADDLHAFVAEAHRLGMRVLLDLVYLHIGPNADIIRLHPEFAKQDAAGSILYSEWNFPCMDFNCPGLREYLWCNMIYYIGVFDIDGYRCDVGDGVPIDFWVEGRRRMRAVKPDSVLINEGSKWDYLLCGFDAIYCYDWHSLLYKAFSGSIPASALRAKWEEIASKLPDGGVLLRDIDNHDTVTDWPARTETVAGHDGMEQIEVLNYTIDGVPMIYCGNELADDARVSMFANRFHMGSFTATDRAVGDSAPGKRRQQIMKTLNSMKKNLPLLQNGKTVWLDNSAPAQIVSFSRDSGTERLIFAGNISDKPCRVKISRFAEGIRLLENGCESADGESVVLAARGYIVIHVQL